MRKVLPLLGKYLLIVAGACALAYYIAQTEAKAAAVGAPMDYAAAGPFTVSSSSATWHDAARTRDVPVQIYAPQIGAETPKPAPRFPVLLFSHGLGGSREGGSIWAGHWASHGYIVVAMQHAGSDEALWKDRRPVEAVKNMKAGMSLSNLGLRVGDVRFVIDEIVRRSGSGEAPFAGADVKRIGMSGHSFGAQTTQAVAGQRAGTLAGQSGLDTRVTAAVAFSPNARNRGGAERQFGDIRIPFFSITGTRDGSILGDGTKVEDRIVPFRNMPAGGKYLAVFDGGDHMVFGGHEFGKRREETARDREIRTAVRAGTLAFWNATLKDDAEARKWLEQGGFAASLGAADRFEAK